MISLLFLFRADPVYDHDNKTVHMEVQNTFGKLTNIYDVFFMIEHEEC